MNFSVIIATYNGLPRLLETIASVQNQTLAAHEIIVVVDGSTDGSANAVRAKYPGVQIVEQPNLGKGIARNTGVARATGDWICLLDHDDLWHRDKLRLLADYIRHNPDAKAIWHNVWLFSETESGLRSGFGIPRDFVAGSLDECHRAAEAKSPGGVGDAGPAVKVDLDAALGRKFGTTSSLAVLRDVYLRAGGFCPSHFNGEDWSFSVNVARITEWNMIPLRLTFMRLHTTSGTFTDGGELMLLATQINAWYGGWPGRSYVAMSEMPARLAKYGATYRLQVQEYLWGCIRKGSIKRACNVMSAGRLLLPRFRDRLYAMIPPQITWRVEHYFFGMHK